MSNTNQFGSGGIKSIQRFPAVSMTSNATDQAISAVNMSKTIVNPLGFTSGGDFTYNPRLALTSTTNVRISSSGPYSGNIVSFEVVEYY